MKVSILSLVAFIFMTLLTLGRYNQKFDLEVSYSDNQRIDMSYKMGEYDLELGFDYLGINQIYSITDVNYVYENAFKSDYQKMTTDWIGPYVVQDMKDIDYDRIQFTGGYHGTEGGIINSSTATCKSVQITIDGKVFGEKDVGYQGRAQRIDIEVVNLIRGWDTTNYLLKETIHYTILKNLIHVSVEIEAIEACIITRYYGMQSQNKGYTGKINYFNETYDFTSNTDIASKPISKKLAIVRHMKIYSKDGTHSLELVMRKLGLGSFEYVTEDVSTCFSTEFRKSYFNLIQGISLELKSGESVSWFGTYIFE